MILKYVTIPRAAFSVCWWQCSALLVDAEERENGQPQSIRKIQTEEEKNA